jgi:hypothetical protein
VISRRIGRRLTRERRSYRELCTVESGNTGSSRSGGELDDSIEPIVVCQRKSREAKTTGLENEIFGIRDTIKK